MSATLAAESYRFLNSGIIPGISIHHSKHRNELQLHPETFPSHPRKKLSNPNPHENPTGIIEPSKAPEHKKRSINTWWYICKSSFRESVLIRGSWSCNYHRTHYDNMLRDKYVQFGSFLLRSKMAGPPRSWGTYWIMTGGYKPLNGPCSTSLTFN